MSPGRASLAGLSALALLLSGCGGSQVTASTYVRSMCVALGSWRNTIQSASVAFQTSGAESAQLAVAKEDYQRFVGALQTATRRATAALQAAGTPEIKHGGQIASRLSAAFDRATRRLARASADARSIQAESATTFQLGASTVNAEVKSALEGIAAVSPGQNQRLRAAAAKEPACQA